MSCLVKTFSFKLHISKVLIPLTVYVFFVFFPLQLFCVYDQLVSCEADIQLRKWSYFIILCYSVYLFLYLAYFMLGIVY